MNLLFLASDFPPAVGGIQTYVAELCAALAARGDTPLILATRQEADGRFDGQFPCEVIRVPSASKQAVARAMSQQAADLIRGRQIDTIAATKWFLEGSVAVSLGRSADIPTILMAYGNEFRLHGLNPVKAYLQRSVLTSVDVATAISRYTAGELIRGGVRPERTQVIGAGVRPEAFACPADEVEALRRELGLEREKVILTVGRVIPRKSHLTMLRALKLIHAAVGPVRHVIVGRGPHEAALRRAAERRRIADLVLWAGHVPSERLPAYYHLCDLFAMCSKAVRGQPVEGFGLVYLDANACGKPVLGADTGGVSDAIEPDVNGLLIAPGDIPAAAAAAIKVLGNPEYAKALGETGLRRIETGFLWSHVAERFAAAVSSAIH